MDGWGGLYVCYLLTYSLVDDEGRLAFEMSGFFVPRCDVGGPCPFSVGFGMVLGVPFFAIEKADDNDFLNVPMYNRRRSVEFSTQLLPSLISSPVPK